MLILEYFEKRDVVAISDCKNSLIQNRYASGKEKQFHFLLV